MNNKLDHNASCDEFKGVMEAEGVYLKASNGVGSNGGVSATHVGRSIDVVKRSCKDKGFGKFTIWESVILGGAGAEQTSAR